MLLSSANNGAKGNAATNSVTKPYWRTEMIEYLVKSGSTDKVLLLYTHFEIFVE